MKALRKNIVVFVMSLPEDATVSVKKYSKENGLNLQTLLIKDKKSKASHAVERADFVVECDLSNSDEISAALLPYQSKLLAITCRSEGNIAHFAKVIPHVPYLRTPSTESLKWATDKYLMRKRFKLFDKKHSLKFCLVENASKKEIKRVIEKVGFPMVIKPTNLAASQLVSICYHEEELEKTLRRAFRKLKPLYEVNKRLEVPRLLAEEFMEGDMYSIDSYVDSRGRVQHCPLVRVKTGRNIGHDDFYNYLRITPTNLKPETVRSAELVAETAIHALSLRSTTTHTELMRVDNDWKIIELGPRIGGTRHKLHALSCGIDHSLNDVLIRIPKKPVIPKKCQGFAAVLRYFADTEGYIESLSGLKRIKELVSFKECTVRLKVGDKAVFSKNGGKGIFDITLYNKDYGDLLADIRRLEKTVLVKISSRRIKKA
jgi:hypothetical protein